MGQDQNYQDKSWLLPALEERLVEFQAAAPCWLLALQGNLPSVVRLPQQSRHSEQSQNLCKPIKARNWATVHDLVLFIIPVPGWQPTFCLKKQKHRTKQKNLNLSYQNAAGLGRKAASRLGIMVLTRHPETAAHMVPHGGGWAHSVQRGWRSWVIPPWDEKEEGSRTAV